jgi:hypothetical protein
MNIFETMKLLSLLFLTYISFLAIEPAGEQLMKAMATEKSCCENGCGNNDCDEGKSNPCQNTDDCCTGGICNPFNLCNCCIGFLPVQPAFARTSHQPSTL